MGRIVFAFLGLVILTVVGGGLYIALGDMPPPTQNVEKTLPNARFAQ